MDKLNIAKIAQGALIEQSEDEIQRILDNIADSNTELKKARKLQITLTFKPSDRETASIEIQTKSSIAPYNPVHTQISIGKDSEGKTAAAEYVKGTIPGQTAIVGTSVIDPVTGEILSESKPAEGRKVVNINR